MTVTAHVQVCREALLDRLRIFGPGCLYRVPSKVVKHCETPPQPQVPFLPGQRHDLFHNLIIPLLSSHTARLVFVPLSKRYVAEKHPSPVSLATVD